jgi:hypothetical protein
MEGYLGSLASFGRFDTMTTSKALSIRGWTEVAFCTVGEQCYMRN